MTCIVGWVEDNDVYIGADSAGTNLQFGQRIRADEKVFVKGEMIFGFTSSFRMGQLLRYSLKIPEQSAKQGDYEYMCTSFMDAVLKTLRSKRYAKTEKGRISIGTFLVGYKGNLYEIESDLQVAKTMINYESVGCGDDLAMGALHALTKAKKLKPEKRIRMALEAASTFSAGVAPPFKILKLKGEKK